MNNNIVKDTKITYIVPVRNMKWSIKRTLSSILNQNPYEIIVVDGKSTDGTSEIIDNISKYHINIKHIYDKAEGPAAALNLGLNHAKGDYVVIIGGDEILNKRFGENLYKIIYENCSPDIICYKLKYMHNNNEWSRIYSEERKIVTRLFARVRVQLNTKIPCFFRIIKTDFILSLNGFDPETSGAEDEDFTIRAMKEKPVIINSNNLVITNDDSDLNPIVELKRGIFYSPGIVTIIRKHKLLHKLILFFPFSLIFDFAILFSLFFFRKEIKNSFKIFLIRNIRSMGYSLGLIKMMM